jgi:hypothetical protein
MCEIAIVDPERTPIAVSHRLASIFHDEQGDGIGFVVVKNEGDRFEYETYKTTTPHWQTVFAFLRRQYSEAWRIVIHGRYGTSGGVNRNTAHPISVECDECEFDHVIHNGSVNAFKTARANLKDAGHEFETEVDTEVIPHVVSELPDTIEDHTRRTYDLSGKLNYLLFSEDGILIRTDYKYHLTDDMVMTCSLDKFNDAEALGMERGTSLEWMLVNPDDDEPEIETKTRNESRVSKYGRAGGAATSRNSARGRGAANWNQYNQNNADSGASASGEQTTLDGDDGTHTVEYEDHSTYDFITAIKVAPGVMKVMNKNEGEEKYLFRDEQPRMYFWYAPEPTPDNVQALEKQAKEGTDEEPLASDEMVESAASVVAEQSEEYSMEDVADIEADIREVMGSESAA